MSLHNIPFSIQKRKSLLDYPKSAAMGFFSKGLTNKFKTAVVNQLSGFEPLKFQCAITHVCKPTHAEHQNLPCKSLG